MIETNRAELWAVSVAFDGFATFGVLACPVRGFLDDFLVRFEESLVRRLCRYAGGLMVHRGSQDSRKWPFQARSRRAFVVVAWIQSSWLTWRAAPRANVFVDYARMGHAA